MSNFEFSLENPIGSLKEYSDKCNLNQPIYSVKEASGPEHSKNFVVVCSFGDYKSEGVSNSIKGAKKESALNLIKLLQIKQSSEIQSSKDINEIISNNINDVNYIGILNEICAKSRYIQPLYSDLPEDASNAAERFQVYCTIKELNIKEIGIGSNKKIAKKLSAKKAFEKYKDLQSNIEPKNELFVKTCTPLESEIPSRKTNFTTDHHTKNKHVSTLLIQLSSGKGMSQTSIVVNPRVDDSSMPQNEIGPKTTNKPLLSPTYSPNNKVGGDNDNPSSFKIIKKTVYNEEYDTKFNISALKQEKASISKHLTFSTMHNNLKCMIPSSVIITVSDIFDDDSISNEEKFQRIIYNLPFKAKLTTSRTQDAKMDLYRANLQFITNFTPNQYNFTQDGIEAEEAERKVKQEALNFIKIMLN